METVDVVPKTSTPELDQTNSRGDVIADRAVDETTNITEPCLTMENNISCKDNINGHVSEVSSDDQNTNLFRPESALSTSEKKVRFIESEMATSPTTQDMDFDLHSAKTRETSILWETVTDRRCSIGKDHKTSSDSTDSVFDSRAYCEDFWEGKEITDLDEDDDILSAAGLKSKNVFRDSLEERRSQKVSVLEFMGDGGYVSLEAGGGAVTPAQGHSCGSLFAQCGADRQSSLVTTYSHGRYGPTEHDSDDSYSGPVSLTEILSEREPVERMCRLDLPMGNGASTKGSQGQSPTDPVLLKKEIRHWEERALELGEEVAILRKEIKSKDHEILRLQREVHKLKTDWLKSLETQFRLQMIRLLSDVSLKCRMFLNLTRYIHADSTAKVNEIIKHEYCDGELKYSELQRAASGSHQWILSAMCTDAKAAYLTLKTC